MEAIDHYGGETSVPDGRFGCSGATINVRYESGTYEFHGVLLHFLRNDRLDSRTCFAHGDKAPLKHNFYGGTIGGPPGGGKAWTFCFLAWIQDHLTTNLTPPADTWESPYSPCR